MNDRPGVEPGAEVEILRELVNAARRLEARGRGCAGLARWLPAYDRDGAHASPVPAWPSSAKLVAGDGQKQAGLLHGCIVRLPFEHRVVMIARDLLDLTQEEATYICGHAAAECRVFLHEARLSVRGMLSERFVLSSDYYIG